MKLNIIFLTSRKVTIELEGAGRYWADREYQILLNGETVMTGRRVVETVTGLEPNTRYTIEVSDGQERSGQQVFQTEEEFVTLDVRQFGARGDGEQDDTLFLQAAINACPPKGRVWIPEGIYRVVTLFLKSDVTIDLDRGAVLSASTDRSQFPVLPGLIRSSDGETEYHLGTWEGNPEEIFTSVITGINVSNVVITGEGTIDGNAGHENWWKDARGKAGGAFRPRMIFLNHCDHVTVQGITVRNSPSWTLHPYFSDHTRWIGLSVENPRESPNTDGMDPESVNGLEAAGVRFSLGDDCIALKSGKYYMGHKYKVPSQNIEIRHCLMQNGHGAVTLGSEMAAGIRNVVCRDCDFEGTDRGLRIKTRRGRGTDAVIDGITFRNIRMDGVLTPFVVNSFYWCCDPDGKSEYVRCKEPLPVDDRTPSIRSLTFQDIEAENCHVAGAFIYGLPEAKIGELTFQNIGIDYAKDPVSDYPAMMADVEPCSRKGIYINNVSKLIINRVRVNGQEGPMLEIRHVDEYWKDGVKQP